MATASTIWRKALSANSTNDTALTTKVPTTTKPVESATNGVYEVDRLADSVHSLLKIMPFGENAADEAFEGEIWIWMPDNQTGASQLWIPELVIVYTATLGNIAQSETTTFLADTITEDAGDTDTSRAVSFGDDSGPATLLVDITGAYFIEFEFDRSTAAECNCYWRLIS